MTVSRRINPKKSQKGAVAVEAALSAALFFILLLIIFDLLWVLYTCVMGQFVVNQAARMAAVQNISHTNLHNNFLISRLHDLNIKTNDIEFSTCIPDHRAESGNCKENSSDLNPNSTGLMFINLRINNPGLLGFVSPSFVVRTVVRIEDKD